MKDYPFTPKVFTDRHGMSRDWLHHKYAVACPICGSVYNILQESVTENGQDNYKTSAPVYRGDLVRVPFLCEAGHKWEICFGFHKGNTFVFLRDPRKVEL